MFLNLGQRKIDLSVPRVMGVINMTPDSFSDGSKYQTLDDALSVAVNMERDGAAIIDIGGESTRPGAKEVPTQAQLDRVIPLIEAIKKNSNIVISIDSGNPEVIKEAIRNGAELVNDVYALQKPGALEVVAQSKKAVCLMHMQNQPASMQNDPVYNKLPDDILDFFRQRINDCQNAGIASDRIVIDPGFGFGKNMQHNLLLLKYLNDFTKFKAPICVGLSRKQLIGDITSKPIEKRLIGGIAAALYATRHGANIVRTHDVAATIDALEVVNSINSVDLPL